MDLMTVKILAIVGLGIISLFFGLLPIQMRRCLFKTGQSSGTKRQTILSFLLCYGAGVLFAAVMIHMMPEIREGFDRVRLLRDKESHHDNASITMLPATSAKLIGMRIGMNNLNHAHHSDAKEETMLDVTTQFVPISKLEELLSQDTLHESPVYFARENDDTEKLHSVVKRDLAGIDVTTLSNDPEDTSDVTTNSIPTEDSELFSTESTPKQNSVPTNKLKPNLGSVKQTTTIQAKKPELTMLADKIDTAMMADDPGIVDKAEILKVSEDRKSAIRMARSEHSHSHDGHAHEGHFHDNDFDITHKDDLSAHEGHDHSAHEGHDHSAHEGHDHSAHEGHDHGTHEGHDHGTHEGHDHGTHEGHDHGTHEGHDHGTHEGHDHSAHEGHDHSAHEGHDHSAHEGHDHGTHEGHDHGSHEGHDHGSHEGHDHGSHEGHDHAEHSYPLTELFLCLGVFLVYFVEELVNKFLGGGNHGHSHGHSHVQIPDNSAHAYSSPNSHPSRGYKGTGSRACWTPTQIEGVETSVLSDESDTVSWNSNNKIEHNFQGQTGRNSGDVTPDAAQIPVKPTCSQVLLSNIRSILMVLALSFHSTFEGLAIGLQENAADVVYLTLAVAAHKLVIHFSVSLELLTIGVPTLSVLLYTFVMALTNPIGGSLGMFLTADISYYNDADQLFAITILQALSGGTILYVVFFEIMERERGKEGSRMTKFFAFLLGFIFLAVIENFGAHSHAPIESEGAH